GCCSYPPCFATNSGYC
uniref:Alpha-conotoxin AuIC n=1 Tax=Conus aulicus TaxID=89437 RepID=CA1C_CONAL|nr:RecName: Full=Alpha-conotoxin AuIC [Conus aulicus]